MKKLSLVAIKNALVGYGYEDEEILAELEKEITKDQARKEANANAYEEVHDLIVGALGDEPATCTEIYDSIEKDLPDGFGKGKVQYALTHLWQDEIVKVVGKPNGYKRA